MLELTGVSRSFRPPGRLLSLISAAVTTEEVTALDGIDLRVDAGEVLGLIGPNGAGKTTLIRIIAGLLSPDSGTVIIGGRDQATDPIGTRRQVSLVLADDRALYWRLNARQNLEFHASLYGIDRRTIGGRIDELLRRVGLGEVGDRRVAVYSTGMRAKLAIARALIQEPRLLVLDEPTRSLDPLAAMEANVVLRELADDGLAVILASHRLDELARLADRVAVLMGHRIRFDGTVRELQGSDAGLVDSLTSMLAADEMAERQQ